MTVMGLTMNQPVINLLKTNVFQNCFMNSEHVFITILISQQSTAYVPKTGRLNCTLVALALLGDWINDR